MLDITTLRDQVYQILRDRIITGQLIPGQRLDVDDLSQSLGVSPTPVKDALKQLAAEGLIDIRPRRGTFVAEFTRRDIEELFDVRLMMELHAVDAGLANATREDDGQLRQILEYLSTFIDGDGYRDYQTFLVHDIELHGYLVRLTGNRRLVEMYESIRLNILLVRAYAIQPVKDAQATYQEHQAIVTAFEQRSAEALRVAIRRHETNRMAHLRTILSHLPRSTNDEIGNPRNDGR
ncbi:MAG: GntR family transcriptional regulator [Ardenticatenaceae bacterium]|nr:GntR family transcriptional regulator [Ardenticatenaceae bacterium]